ncbi:MULTISPECIES: hypothetical protein [unclassified Wolbachia]|uniref:hypothetical protein n=1 Tax=unclassified Wolbachia TaxID=2640676 RepID=UPI002226D649|nr:MULTISPECIES: hypothetical protein [unclassified Wolbachia]MBV2145311.1 hypothetical protein [Wolbachia endosymbiont of Pissodes strobi]WMT83865.1 hypothetical protein NMD99_04070 [Wolbachia endosymbiont of Listronotus oregonensis]WMT83909.1 hypothetical protein NMD99_04345 [Wolbachia endosymbiont of Listronotus oregonensis]
MAQSQKKLNINVSFEGEFAQYLTEVAKAWNKTIPEVLVCLVKEEFEAEKEMAEIIKERDVPDAKTVRSEDVDWDKILSAKTIKDE